MIPALVSGAASLAKGAMDKSAAKKQSAQQYANDMAAMELQREWDLEDRDEQRAYSRMALKHLVEDADAAGFSPMAVLGSGSAPPYNAAAGFAPLSRQAPVRQAVGGSPMGQAFGAAADAFLATYDPHANSRQAESHRIIESAIASRNVGVLSRAPKSSLAVARGDVRTVRPSSVPSVPNLAKPRPSTEENVTNPHETLLVDPKQKDAELYTQRYEEFMSNVIGIGIAARDAWYNVKPHVAPHFDKARNATTKPAANWILRQLQTNPGFRPPALAKGGGLRRW